MFQELSIFSIRMNNGNGCKYLTERQKVNNLLRKQEIEITNRGKKVKYKEKNNKSKDKENKKKRERQREERERERCSLN